MASVKTLYIIIEKLYGMNGNSKEGRGVLHTIWGCTGRSQLKACVFQPCSTVKDNKVFHVSVKVGIYMGSNCHP